MIQRFVHWDGLHNTRDLGGLPTGCGETRFGQFYRAPRLDALTSTGWRQLAEAGVMTLVDLRNADEIKELPVPIGITRHHRPVEDQTVQEFMAAWAQHLNSPIYYSDVLIRWPNKVADVFRCIVDASEGGLLFHCSAGRDRTGMITALLLQLAGVPEDSIADDYLLSVETVNDYPESGEPRLERSDLQRWKAEVRARLLDFLKRWDCAEFLKNQGFRGPDLDRIRQRLVWA